MMRVVLDTNILVSALLGGKLAEILDAWQAGSFTLIVSDDIFAEYIKVLKRPKFGLPLQVVEDIIGYLFQNAEFVTPEQELDVIADDPDDNKFIEAAITGNAEFVVSGDNHLLELGNYQHVEIITAHAFMQRLNVG